MGVHFIIHFRHENILPPVSFWQLAQGTYDIRVKKWLNLWQQIAGKYISFQFDQAKVPWHVSLTAPFMCDKTNLEGRVVSAVVFFYKRNLFGCDNLGSHSEMLNSSGALSLALAQGCPSEVHEFFFKLVSIDLQKVKSIKNENQEFQISLETDMPCNLDRHLT